MTRANVSGDRTAIQVEMSLPVTIGAVGWNFRIGDGGSRTDPTGSRTNPTGSRTNPTGSRIDPTDSRIHRTGSRIHRTGSRIHRTGSRSNPTGSGVDGGRSLVGEPKARCARGVGVGSQNAFDGAAFGGCKPNRVFGPPAPDEGFELSAQTVGSSSISFSSSQSQSSNA